MKLVERKIYERSHASPSINHEKEYHTIDFVYIVCDVHGFNYEYIKQSNQSKGFEKFNN